MLKLCNNTKKFKNKCFKFLSFISAFVLILCCTFFTVSASNVYSIYPYEIEPTDQVFRVVNSNGSITNIYSSTEFDRRVFDGVKQLGETVYWRDVMAVSSGNWSLDYGHSYLMSKFDIFQYNLVDGQSYEITIPFFILAQYGKDLTLDIYGGDVRYSDNLTKMQVKSVTKVKSTFSFYNDSTDVYDIYNGYYGKIKASFTYDALYAFDNIRFTLYFNSAKGVLRWVGIYNSIVVSEIDNTTVAKYNPPDKSSFDNYLESDNELISSVTDYNNAFLGFFKDNTTFIFGNVSFMNAIRCVNNMLLYLWSSSWLGRLVTFSLLIGSFGFVIGTVAVVGRLSRRKE